MKSNKTVFFSGELPPNSLNGIAYSNAILLEHLKLNYSVIIDKEYVDLKFHKKLNLRKSLMFIKRIFNIIQKSYNTKFNYFYLVYSNSFAGSIKTLLVLIFFKLFNRKTIVILHLHRGDIEKQIQNDNLLKYMFNLVLTKTNKLIVLSNELKYFIKAKFKFQNEIICLENTVFNELELPKIYQKSESFNCIYISNYIKEKGILVLLNAFKNLGNTYKLNCYGSFTDESLKEEILAFQSHNISINGPIYDIDKFQLISNSDLLILPSYNEGKPLVLLESMMLGTPFIATKVGYISEMVDSDYPFLFSNVNISELEKLIKQYFSLTLPQKKSITNNLIFRYKMRYSNKVYFNNINKIFND